MSISHVGTGLTKSRKNMNNEGHGEAKRGGKVLGPDRYKNEDRKGEATKLT